MFLYIVFMLNIQQKRLQSLFVLCEMGVFNSPFLECDTNPETIDAKGDNNE